MDTTLRRAYEYVLVKTGMATATLNVAAGSLIGLETLALVLGYATMAPVLVPLIAIGVGIAALVRNRLRRRAVEART